MPRLDEELQPLNQRSGTNAGSLRTDAERASFAANVRKDISSIMYQINTVYKVLVDSMSKEQGLDALDFGIAGNAIFTDVTASAADAEAYWSEDLVRARTVKETFDVLLADIARLENAVDAVVDVQEYDDAAVRALILANDLDLSQLAKDTVGDQYSLDGDGLANNTYSLSQAIDALGAFFAGFPGTGNTYSGTYPALSLVVNLSDINIDTTLPQSAIADLPTDLGYIRTFIGMSTSGPETPTYSTHNTPVFVTDTDSLEKAISDVDAAAGAHAARHERAGADEIDGDHLAIDFTPTNYTPDTTPAEAADVDDLAAHLAGIDNALSIPLGTEVLNAPDIRKLTADAGPVLVVEEYTNIVIETLDYDAGASEKAYGQFSIPVLENGDRPTKVRFVGSFVVKPNGGPYPSGDGFAFSIATGTAGGLGTTLGGAAINSGYQPPVTETQKGLAAGSVDQHFVLTWSTITLATNGAGVLSVRVARETADAADTWQDDVGLLKLQAIWYA